MVCVLFVAIAICSLNYQVDAVAQCAVSGIGTQPGCNYCVTATSVVNGMATTSVQTCAQTCTPMTVAAGASGNQVTCCTTDFCNGGSATGGTFSCYLSGGNTQAGCTACQKTEAKGLGITALSTKACITAGSTCTPTTVGGFVGTGYFTYCCNTNLCNSATSVQVSLISAFIVALVALLFSNQ